MKTLKLFAVCCGMLLAGVVSTTKTTAQVIDPGGLDTGVNCVGDDGTCLVVKKGNLTFVFSGEKQ
ncbi:MAG: hypothetical protein IJK46_10590 [Prevotella sp.]|nr:hypothetical protein [Prevotella sp.]